MTRSAATRTPATSSGVRCGALAGYRWLLAAFLLLGVVQIFLAGLGVFSLDGQKLGAAGETAFDPHPTLGFAMGGVALLILVLALLARPGARDHPGGGAAPADIPASWGSTARPARVARHRRSVNQSLTVSAEPASGYRLSLAGGPGGADRRRGMTSPSCSAMRVQPRL
jgi:hypothetical protein